MSSEASPGGQGPAAAGAGSRTAKKQRLGQPSGSDVDPDLSPDSGDDAAEMEAEQAPAAATATAAFDAVSEVAAAATASTAPFGGGASAPPRRKIIIPRSSPATASRGSGEGRAALEGGVAALLAAADDGQGPSGLDLAAGGWRRGRADVASPGAAVAQ